MKFSIVTPAWNSERFIAETIESVVSQKGDFEIEYIIQDNCSTDNTVAIVKDYQQAIRTGQRRIFCKGIDIQYRCRPDKGMYDALNNAFAQTSGDVQSWINADDIYLPGALSIIQRSLEEHPEIHWIKGITSYIDERSLLYAVGNCNLYRQDWLHAGVYGPAIFFVQQDSVFWRSALWQDVPETFSHYKLAGDFFLWQKFSQKHHLYSLDSYISCFRKVQGQKSESVSAYQDEALASPLIDIQQLNKVKRVKRYLKKTPAFLQKSLFTGAFGDYRYRVIVPEANRPTELRTLSFPDHYSRYHYL